MKFGKWKYISSIKMKDETDISVQIYSFLKVTVALYDEKPDKDVISVILW